MDEPIARRKAALRTSTRAARRGLSAGERARAAATVVGRIGQLPEVRRAGTVLFYAAMSDEVELAGLVGAVRHRGARTLFPKVRDDDLDLIASTDLRSLEPGYRGVREPMGPRVDPGFVDVALVPGVAFDPTGGRLGQGGGHYDRLLPRLAHDCVRIGVCFACQLVPRVPRESHDARVDVVVTETGVHRRGDRD